MKKKDLGSQELEPTRFEMQTRDLLVQTLTNLAQGITGLAASSRQDVTLSIGHLFQRLRGGQFLSTLSDEWNKYREKGRIKDDYQYSEQHKACLQELLDFLDSDAPDELRFSILKKIFLVSATETVSDRNSHLPLKFMQIARSLTSGEILVLEATFRIGKDTSLWEPKGGAGEWLIKIAEHSGLRYPELVETHEEGLIRKYLVSRRVHADKSGVSFGQRYRLTDLGFELCDYIEKYTE